MGSLFIMSPVTERVREEKSQAKNGQVLNPEQQSFYS